ncbi:hypothetical protein [Metapseudomonas otitidis]|uniref:hypothetical protein n=1 Tax=Metapseudomonas otitidis TaxID=319939 RepID=UPI001F22E778|nr:hypothetical protein [Pseudomonas otitidis]MCO7558027.1 hypothetical protein [Pseudomonas otitidis]
MSDIEILFPAPVSVTVGRLPVLIHPVRLPDFERFGVAGSRLFEMLGNFTAEEIYRYAKESGDLKVILLRCTSLTRWSLRRLPAATAVELMVHVVRVNSGFFGRALVVAASVVAGSTSSSS